MSGEGKSREQGWIAVGFWPCLLLFFVFLVAAPVWGVEDVADEEAEAPDRVTELLALTEEELLALSSDELRELAAEMEQTAVGSLEKTTALQARIYELRSEIRESDPGVEEIMMQIRELTRQREELIDQHHDMRELQEELAGIRGDGMELLRKGRLVEMVLRVREEEATGK